MAYDFFIPLEDLESIKEKLTDITEEFADAVNRSEDLEDEIGKPFGRGDLKDRVEDFETRWDIKRDNLAEQLGGVLEHLTAVIDNTDQFDADAAIALTPEES
ncbi:flagellar protein FlgN [Microbacterium excoecariae]|uniref:flagellar protein FlgN n=1 Tax=Microbacterium excoecariae TaxID=2715210 RepID=UPI001408DE68|nr:flagellar protein FlgN [Microbacterium excoecariae]NHI16028.1 flagellar protein FlgN [Microbacterium excoecariae]